MDFFNSKRFICILVLVIIYVGMSGCTTTKVITNKVKEPITLTDSIGNMGAIGRALGCMFGSSDPMCDSNNSKNAYTDVEEDFSNLETEPSKQD